MPLGSRLPSDAAREQISGGNGGGGTNLQMFVAKWTEILGAAAVAAA